MSGVYDRVKHFLTQRGRAYRLCFGSPAGRSVLVDLADFCRARETCVVAPPGQAIDRDRSLILEGRREVWLRIQQHIRLTDEQLYTLFVGPMENPNG
jgi:hypothetical protein